MNEWFQFRFGLVLKMEFPEIIDNKNQERQLDYVLNHFVFQSADLISIAVGYFYFSGFQQIAEALSKNEKLNAENSSTKIRFIISPKTDRLTANILQKGNQFKEIEKSAIAEFEQDLSFANPTWAEYLIELLQKKVLEVKIYTKDFFHAKAYLASIPLSASINSYVSIVGSSNFSFSGLTDNSELNLGNRNDHVYKELLKWYDDLWENHTEDFNHKLLEVIDASGIKERKETDTPKKFLSPFQMLLFLLKHYLGKLTEDTTHNFDQLAEFQRIGAENVLTKLERFGGAIVADSVGLGKTFTAGEVIRRYRLENKKVIIICPPTLIDQWKETMLINFGVDTSTHLVIYSQGKFQQLDPAKVRKEFKEIDFDLIVIDEAHRLRNRETALYRNVKELHPHTREKRADVLLLTATPFNNSVMDLKNLIELAILPVTLTNAGFTPNAFGEFMKITSELRNKKSLSELKERPEFQNNLFKIQEILNAVMLLRMRSTIKEKYGNITIAGKPLQFEDPSVEKIQYKYEDKHHYLFNELPGFLQKLHLPHILISNPDSGKMLSYLYLLLLFKRIESSIYAFYESLLNIIAKEEALDRALDAGGNLEEIIKNYNANLKGDLADEDTFDLFTDEKVDEEELKEFSKDDLKNWIREDLTLIHEFIDSHIKPLFKDPKEPLSLEDPKIFDYITQLKGRFKKCLTFTEYKATVRYIDFHIKKSVSNQEISIRHEMVSGGDKFLNDKLNRFAPKGRKVSEDTYHSPEFQELDLLISTDVLSEGVNLQDADLLINYDLPWNPMRIVQRIGRVNRIGSENKIRVLNFIPDEILNDFIQLVEILTSKIDQVSVLLGKEMAILSSNDEKITSKTIGEEIQKVRSAKSASEVESLSRKTELFRRIEGETEEDFFRLKLHLSARENQVRKEDFKSEFFHDRANNIYYTILNKEPKSLYQLYEIQGEHGDRRDLLSRFWLYATNDGNSKEKHPDEFLTIEAIQKNGYSLYEVSNKEECKSLEKKLVTEYARLLSEKREINSVRNVSRRITHIKGRQMDVLILLQTLLHKEQTLTGKSFTEVVLAIRPDGKEILEDTLSVLQIHQLNAEQINKLNKAIEKRNLKLSHSINPSQYKDVAEMLFDYYEDVILSDSMIRGYLYKPVEINGRLLASIYV